MVLVLHKFEFTNSIREFAEHFGSIARITSRCVRRVGLRKTAGAVSHFTLLVSAATPFPSLGT